MDTTENNHSILVKGKNYWKMGRAHRVSFLIDASEYFSAFVDAVMNARRSIYITGWDIDSRTKLIRDGNDPDIPVHLGDLLNYAASKNPSLNINILLWDYAMLYALDREPFPVWVFDWKTSQKIHFYQDNSLPLGASHHQKIVVVDDRIAFVGGIDLTNRRWDVREHQPYDPRRVDPWGKEYPPFHDVQLLVDGQVASILGDLFRSRWHNATGRSLSKPEWVKSDPWPGRFHPDINEIDVAVSRTEPAYRGKAEIREVESLWMDAILAARKIIYIENPFFTSSKIAGAIAKRLQEKDGPEVVVITRKKSHGWLEEYTMDAIRSHLAERVRKLDTYGRFGFYHPEIPGREDSLIEVHSKVLIIDDTFMRVGSSNLANRSMGFDTECDLSMETLGHPQACRVCIELRNRLLAEHLDSTPSKVSETLEKTGSLIKTIETLGNANRVLLPLVPSPVENNILAEPYLVDPERPIRAEKFVERFVGEENQGSGGKRLISFVVLVLVMVLLAVLWRWSPLAAYLDVARIMEELKGLQDNPLAPVIILAFYLLGGLVAFPVLILVVMTSFLFDPFSAFALAMGGSLMSGTMMFWIGNALGRKFVRAVAGKRINRLSRNLARQGLLTIVILRIVPIAPYSIINLVAGASHIRFRDFFIGTIIGMLPGIFAITLFTESLKHFILEPSIFNIAVLTGSVTLAAAILIWLMKIARRISRKSAGEKSP
jgi:phospholipase D1/2